jgi:hypothetical protein
MYRRLSMSALPQMPEDQIIRTVYGYYGQCSNLRPSLANTDTSQVNERIISGSKKRWAKY